MRGSVLTCLALAFAPLLILGGACESKTEETRPKSAEEVEPPQAEGQKALDAAPDPKCEARPSFEELDWMPDTRLAMLVAARDEDLEAALSSLRAGGGTLDPPLPVYANFELKNLALELRALSLVYEPLGLAPEQLLKVHGPKNESVWFVPAPCDHEALAKRAEARWQVGFRGDGSAKIGIAPADAALPFDLLLLPGARLGLVPRGRAGAVQLWMLGGGKPATTVGDAPEAAERVPPGRELLGTSAAPIRLRLEGRALGASVGADGASADRIRVDRDGAAREPSAP